MREVLKSEIFNAFKEFSDKNDAKFNFSIESDINSGGSIKYFSIDVEKNFENCKVKITQAFSFLFSNPEQLIAQTGLFLTIEKHVRADFYLHFWPRELVDRIFSLYKIDSGNLIFDKKFSAKSNDRNLTNSLFRNSNIQNLFLTNKLLLLNINSINMTAKITLKNMALKKYETWEIEKYFNFLLGINKYIN